MRDIFIFHFAIIILFIFIIIISTRLFLVFMSLYRSCSSTTEEEGKSKSLSPRAEGKAFIDSRLVRIFLPLRVAEMPRELVESSSLEIFQTHLDRLVCHLLQVTMPWHRAGLTDLQRTLPALTILWFCDSRTLNELRSITFMSPPEGLRAWMKNRVCWAKQREMSFYLCSVVPGFLFPRSWTHGQFDKDTLPSTVLKGLGRKLED